MTSDHERRSSKSGRIRWRRARREVAERHERLVEGEAVVVPCTARRTTSRGWGMWVDGGLWLPGPEGGTAEFMVDDPNEVALVTRRGEAPVTLDQPLEVTVRSVRYKAEAFHGSDAQIIVATSPRRVVEIAVRNGDLDATVRRLRDLA